MLSVSVDCLKSFIRISLLEVREFPYELDIFVKSDFVPVFLVCYLVFHFVVFFMFCSLSGYANEYTELKDFGKRFC